MNINLPIQTVPLIPSSREPQISFPLLLTPRAKLPGFYCCSPTKTSCRPIFPLTCTAAPQPPSRSSYLCCSLLASEGSKSNPQLHPCIFLFFRITRSH
jgi:hypothetical protein